jgi:pentose-5-phosphate-3-epimerase
MIIDNKYTVKITINKNIIEIKKNLTFDDAYKLCTTNLNPITYHIMLKEPVKKIIDTAASGSIILVGYEEDINTKVRNTENFMIREN